MKLVDALVGTLRDWGVRYLFGVSGANIEHLHDAIHRLGQGRLESVLARSELGAAFMADARARTHRTLGVCCATSGGGMMNLAVGVAESYAESVPVLAILGQIPAALEGRGGFQDSSGVGRTVDALSMWRAMSRLAVRVDGAEGFWEKLADAARAALSGRPGPSVLLVTRDAHELEVPARPAGFPVDLAELMRPLPAPDAKVGALLDSFATRSAPSSSSGAAPRDRAPPQRSCASRSRRECRWSRPWRNPAASPPTTRSSSGRSARPATRRPTLTSTSGRT